MFHLTAFGLLSNFVAPLALYICLWRLACIKFENLVRKETDDPKEIEALLRVMHPAKLGGSVRRGL